MPGPILGRSRVGGDRRASPPSNTGWIFRPGGAYRLVMRSPEGTDHRKRGVYRRIDAPERVEFTFAWEAADGSLGNETLITVTFEDRWAPGQS